MITKGREKKRLSGAGPVLSIFLHTTTAAHAALEQTR